MANPSNSHAQAAIQLLVWAIEEIEKADNPQAASHARSALKCLQRISGGVRYTNGQKEASSEEAL